MIRSYCSLKMAAKVVEMCDFKSSMVACKLAFPHPLELTETPCCRPHHHCNGTSIQGTFGSIEEVEGEEEQQDELPKQDFADSSITSSSASSAQSQSGTSPAVKNRQIMKYMCSSALTLFSITALLLLLPLVLPPLPPPPSELMLLPVAILLLLVCAALSPRSSSLPSAALTPCPQSIPLLPLAHSLPLRSSMQL